MPEVHTCGLAFSAYGQHEGVGVVALRQRRISRAAASIVVLFAGVAFAILPTSAPAQAALTRDEVLRLPAPLRASASDFGAARCDSSPVVGLLPGESALVPSVVGIELDGATVLPKRGFERVTGALSGVAISREGLGRLASAVECLYRERGFVFARATVTADAAAAGRFRVSVTEGKVRRVEALAESESLARIALRAFAAVREGRPLNAGEVRRGLANSASVGLTDVRPTIRRSRIDPNALDLVLIVSSAPEQMFAQAQNGNSPALGPVGVLAGTRIAGLTPLGERTTVGVYAATQVREQWSAQFDSEALLHGGLKGRLGGAYARSRPGDVLEPLEIDAKTLFLVGELSSPLLVRRGLVTAWRGGLESVDQQSTFLGGLPLGDDRLRVGFLALRADGLLDQGLWQAELQLRRGLDVLGASRLGDAGLSRVESDPTGFVVRADGDFGVQVSRYLTVRGSLRSQWTRNPLIAFERINFGGLTGGQGFDPGALSGDSGVTGTLQFHLPAMAMGGFGSVRPYIHLAGARLWTVNDQGLGDAQGASAGVGLQWAPGGAWQVEAVWAEPIGRIKGAGEDVYGPRFLLRISAAFERGKREVTSSEAR